MLRLKTSHTLLLINCVFLLSFPCAPARTAVLKPPSAPRASSTGLFYMKAHLLLLLLPLPTIVGAVKQKVLLREGMALTFNKGAFAKSYVWAYTSAGTAPPVLGELHDSSFPRLQCEGANCGAVAAHVASVQCKAQGIDDMGAMSWRCSGEIPRGCNFGNTRVSCEGFNGVDDAYIVPGSCGLIYTLNCARLDASQNQERKERAALKSKREAQQVKMLARLQQIEGREAAEKCELAIAGALFPIGIDVELMNSVFPAPRNKYASMVDPSGELLRKGTILDIDCDGSYTFEPELRNAFKNMHHVKERDLRVWVATIYKSVAQPEPRTAPNRPGAKWTKADDVAERCGSPLCSGHGACRSTGPCECEEPFTGKHCEHKPLSSGAIIATVLLLLIAILSVYCLQPRGAGAKAKRSGNGRRNGATSAAPASKKAPAASKTSSSRNSNTSAPPPKREVDKIAMATKRDVLTSILATQAKLRVARVQAKHNASRLAALDKYTAEMEQLQRDVTNGTAQLAHAMKRVDHVCDRYEAVGYATTETR